jgi:hypothetical protein
MPEAKDTKKNVSRKLNNINWDLYFNNALLGRMFLRDTQK